MGKLVCVPQLNKSCLHLRLRTEFDVGMRPWLVMGHANIDKCIHLFRLVVPEVAGVYAFAQDHRSAPLRAEKWRAQVLNLLITMIAEPERTDGAFGAPR